MAEGFGEERLVVLPVGVALDGCDGKGGDCDDEKRDSCGFAKFSGCEMDEARCGENEEETEADGGEIEVAFGEDVAAYGVDVHCGKEGDSDPERGEGRERDPAHEVDEAGDGGEDEDDGCDGARVGEGADGREDVVGVELERPCEL